MFCRNEFDIGRIVFSWPEITESLNPGCAPTAKAQQSTVLEYRYPGAADIQGGTLPWTSS
jgi:hypothetical protein